MKTRISIAIFSLFLIACGNSTQQSTQTGPPAPPAPLDQTKTYVLKGANNLYLSLNSDSVLVADQSDLAKATVFEKTDIGTAKCSFKTASGKFVSHDRIRNDCIIANRNYVGEWETFEIVHIDSIRVNIKTSNGKFITADQAKGNKLFGNHAEAKDPDAFVFIKK